MQALLEKEVQGTETGHTLSEDWPRLEDGARKYRKGAC